MKQNSPSASIWSIIVFIFLIILAPACSKNKNSPVVVPPPDEGLVNEQHLDHLYVPVIFSDGTKAGGIYVYSEYPDYHLVEASGEGYTCVDDVSRAALFYLRSPGLKSDTSKQAKLFSLMEFLLMMQSPSGYFYNFLQTGGSINMVGPTSIAQPNWWSWRALQSLSESLPVIRGINAALADKISLSIQHLILAIESDIIPLPETTEVINGITIPAWLPEGSGTDQSATLMLGLIDYSMQYTDTVIIAFIRKLADGIMLMQQGDSVTYPYSMILSWQNQWHAYGSDQAYALLCAGDFLHDKLYQNAALNTVNNFFPRVLQNNYKSSVIISRSGGITTQISANNYDQIAYGFRPMIFATAKAFQLTGQPQYSDLAGKLSAWFLSANDASAQIYDPLTGICFDAISAGNQVNKNSGAESTIEALLSFQIVESIPEIKTALNKYKR